MPGSYVAFNLLPSDPFDLLASCIVSLTQRINKYVCMYVVPVMSAKQTDILLHVFVNIYHLIKNSHIFQHINGSEACRSLCSEDCFSILDTASTPFQLKTKEALHIAWEKPSLNKQVNHVNLTLSL